MVMERQRINEQRGPGIVAIVVGIVAVAFCCFAPIILAALGAVGLAALFRQYLPYFLLLAAAIVVLVGILSYRRWRSRSPHQ